MFAHVLPSNIPNSKKNTLPLVVARAVLVRLSEIANRDGAVDGRNNLRQTDVAGGLGKDVPATDTAF